MRKAQYLTLALALALLLGFSLAVRAASARCLDEGDDCRLPAPRRTLAPLWTASPAPALDVAPMSTDMPPLPTVETLSGYPALPPTATPASGYPGQPPSPTAPADCQLDWSLPVTGNNWNALQDCFGYKAMHGWPPAEICPPVGSAWVGIYFGPPGYCD